MKEPCKDPPGPESEEKVIRRASKMRPGGSSLPAWTAIDHEEIFCIRRTAADYPLGIEALSEVSGR